MDIDPAEAKIIFTLLDSDRSGSLTLQEFINGVIKTKGYAKNIDVLSMMYDANLMSCDIRKISTFIEEQMHELRGTMNPGYDKPQSMFDEANIRNKRQLNTQRSLAALSTPVDKFVEPLRPQRSGSKHSSQSPTGIVPGQLN